MGKRLGEEMGKEKKKGGKVKREKFKVGSE